MPSMYWIKLYHEILRDPKMGRLPDRAWRRAIELFLLAGEMGEDGELPSVADIAWQLRIDESELEEDMAALAEVGILTVTDDEWRVTKFAARQGPSPVGERVARYRDRKRKAQYDGNVSETAEERDDNDNGNEDVTTRYTESDTDTDTDTDIGAAAPESFAAWKEKLRGARNKAAVIMEMHGALYPEHDLPDYGRIGAAAKQVGGWARLAQLTWENSTRPPVGSVMDFVTAVSKNNGRGHSSPRASPAPPSPPEALHNPLDPENVRK